MTQKPKRTPSPAKDRLPQSLAIHGPEWCADGVEKPHEDLIGEDPAYQACSLQFGFMVLGVGFGAPRLNPCLGFRV